ncbi:MAG: NAD(+)/NADH kinase [Candidatus Omnitrophica bacterium]|nr:NAD(+)/NADH kinase [Candidatus Omnitrophota bacterium]
MKILILYNAWSGHKRVNFSAYLDALAKRGAHVETRTIGESFNLKELLTDAQSFDRVVIAGGDGTVSTAAGILQNTGVPIVAYPGGTANLLALNLGMPFDPLKLVDVTLNGRPVPTDLGEIEYTRFSRRDYWQERLLKRHIERAPAKVYFSVMAGCGFSAQMMSEAQPLKSKWGEAAYWISAFLSLFPRRARFSLTIDGRKIQTAGIGILLLNFEKIQFDLKVVGSAHASDGRLEIMVVKARSLFGLIPILWGAIRAKFGLGRPHLPEIMETYQAAEIEVLSHPPLRLQFDGELLKKASRFKVHVCPGATIFIYGTQESLQKSPNPVDSASQETR